MRTLLLLLALGCTTSAVVRDLEPDTQVDSDTDTDADTDSDTDTDTDTDADPDLLEPEYMYVGAYLGLLDHELVEWSYDGSPTSSYLFITLATVEYFDDYDPDLACLLYYLPEASPVDPDWAWLAWDVEWIPYFQSETCERLDPDLYGHEPLYEMGVESGRLTIEDMTLHTAVTLDGWYGTSFEDDEHVVSSEMELGDFDEHYDYFREWDRELQLFYGYAYKADDEMETSFSEEVGKGYLERGRPAVVGLNSLTFPAPGTEG